MRLTLVLLACVLLMAGGCEAPTTEEFLEEFGDDIDRVVDEIVDRVNEENEGEEEEELDIEPIVEQVLEEIENNQPSPPPPPDPQVLIVNALDAGDVTTLETLIHEGNVNTPVTYKQIPVTPLYIAVENEHLAVVEALIEAGADVDMPGLNFPPYPPIPLYRAIQKGNLDIVRVLIENGANVDGQLDQGNHNTPLYVASDRGHLDIVNLLIEEGAEVSTGGYIQQCNDVHGTPLSAAISGNHATVATALLGAGAEAKIQDFEATIRRENADMLDDLIATGVDVNAEDACSGEVPFDIAIGQHVPNIAVVNTLIESEADVNARNGEDEYSYLFVLINRSTIAIAVTNALIQAGADVNIRQEFGMAAAGAVEYEPIHAAAYRGHASAVTTLANAGANVNSVSGNGTHPLSHAFSRSHREAFDALRQAGATLPCEEWSIPCHNYYPEYREWLGLPPLDPQQ